MPSFVDISGQTFGRLTAISRAPTVSRRTFWNCRCDCGGSTVARADQLRAGHTRSCGCLHAEWCAVGSIGEMSLVHGMSGTVEHAAFKGARDRCNNPANDRWHGRGIEFRFASFDEFFGELGPRPSPAHSVDRIDNDGHYEVGNVRWATAKQQANNRRNSLSDLQVQLMRAHHVFGEQTRQIARLFGCSRGYAHRIVTGAIRREAGGYLHVN